MTPPLASSSARPATWATAARAAAGGSMLSSSIRGAPAASASSTSASVAALDLERQVGARRTRTAAPPPPPRPRRRDVVLLDEDRVVEPGAVVGRRRRRATAAFSSVRSPGVVLRVSRIRAPVPSTACDRARRRGGHAGQALEEVQRRALSGQQRRARRPSITSTAPPSRHSPSAAAPLERDLGIECAGTWPRRASSPKITPGAFCVIVAIARASAGHGRGGRHVARRRRPRRAPRATSASKPSPQRPARGSSRSWVARAVQAGARTRRARAGRRRPRR